MSVMMLELKANYEPAQNTVSVRQIQNSRPVNQAAERNSSFNRALAKANQRKQQMVKSHFDQESNTRTTDDQSIQDSEFAQNASPKTESAATVQTQTDAAEQSSGEVSLSNSDSQDQTGMNAGDSNLTVLVPNSQAVPTEPQMQGNETESDTSQLQLAIQSVEPALQNQSETVPIPIAELASGMPVDAGPLTDMIQAETVQTGPASQVQVPLSADAQTLTENAAATTTETPQPLPESQTTKLMMNQTATGELTPPVIEAALAAIIGQQADTTASVQSKEKITLKVKLTETGDAATSGDEAEASETQGNSVSKEDLRFKLIEKIMVNKNQKTGKEQPASDIKKIIVSESQRLVNPTVVSEETGLSETSLSASNQTDSLTTGTGFEKSMFTASRAEHMPPTVSTHSNAQNVNAQEVIDQIVQKAELLKSETSNAEMRIQLKPGFLGKMVIKIAVEDGLVTAKFVTESQHVKQLLEANLISLKQNLEAQGLKVDRTEVNVQLDNGGSFHGNESGRELMWNEMRDGNGQNRSSYQGLEEYQQGLDTGLESVLDTTQEAPANYVMDGRVDFMI